MTGGELSGRKIVITGVTGLVARPLALALAGDNEVVGAARFTDQATRASLDAAGVRCVQIDLAAGDVSSLPPDADVVLHFAVAKSNNWDVDLAANSGGLAHLMEHHKDAAAFLHCSTTAVYRPEGHRIFAEDGPLGDNHGVWPFLRTYSICKIAAEGAARWAAARFVLPTTIARLSVPYGERRMARCSSAHDAGGACRPRARRCAQRVPPHPSRRHGGHDPAVVRGGVCPGHRRQLRRERRRQHRGVVWVPGRAHGDHSPFLTDQPHHRQRADRHHPHA